MYNIALGSVNIISINIICIVTGDLQRGSGAGRFFGQVFSTGAVFREGGFRALSRQ